MNSMNSFSKKKFSLFWLGSEQRIQTKNEIFVFFSLYQYVEGETVAMEVWGHNWGHLEACF